MKELIDLLILRRLELYLNKGIRLRLVILLFRLASFSLRGKARIRFVFYPIRFIYRIYTEFLLCIEIPVSAQIGPGLVIYHGTGLVLHPGVIIGSGCILRHGVTIGNKGSKVESGLPIIGDNVEFGTGSMVIGKVHIGDNVVIGAGVVVTKSIAFNSILVGQSPRIIQRT
jgi:serine acetyltransferase